MLDLVCLLEGMNPESPADIRRTAVLLDERFPASNAGKAPPPPASQRRSAGQKPEAGSGEKIVVNAPLDFALKNLDPNHPYLLGRGFSPEIIEHFGLGFCSKGLMKDRITPTHRVGLVSTPGVDHSLVDAFSCAIGNERVPENVPAAKL